MTKITSEVSICLQNLVSIMPRTSLPFDEMGYRPPGPLGGRPVQLVPLSSDAAQLDGEVRILILGLDNAGKTTILCLTFKDTNE